MPGAYASIPVFASYVQPIKGGHFTKHRISSIHRSSPPSYLPIPYGEEFYQFGALGGEDPGGGRRVFEDQRRRGCVVHLREERGESLSESTPVKVRTSRHYLAQCAYQSALENQLSHKTVKLIFQLVIVNKKTMGGGVASKTSATGAAWLRQGGLREDCVS